MSTFEDQLEDLFAPLGGVSLRRMFGGLGVFKDGLMFACVVDGTLCLKADEKTAAAFENEGCEQWSYQSRDRKMAMPYWQAPERLFDEPDEFADWARTAFAVAVRTKKPARKKSAPKAKPPTGKTGKTGKKPAKQRRTK